MKPSRLLIIGTGGHAKSVIDACELQGEYQICGLVDDYEDVGGQLFGYDVVGAIEDIPKLITNKNIEYLFIAVGDNNDRLEIYKKLLDTDAKWATIIHPSAVIAKNTTICTGSVVLAGAVVNTMTFIDQFAIINTNASVDHDNNIGQFASIAPNACTGGKVKVGAMSVVGIGATVSNGKTIGEWTVIGAGAVVVSDIKDRVVAYGVPCKAIRSRDYNEKYL